MSKTNLDKLLEQRAQLEARIQQVRSREAAEKRKWDTRRRILAGAYMIKLAENDLQRVGRELIAAGMLQPRDYGLFDLAETTGSGE